MRKNSIVAVVGALMMWTVVAVPTALADGATRDTVNTAADGLPAGAFGWKLGPKGLGLCSQVGALGKVFA